MNQPIQKEQLSAAKYAELEKEVLERKSTIRVDILERLKAAKALGDLKENAEYHVCRDEQGKNEDRIKWIEYLLKNAEIVEAASGGVAMMGSTLTVAKQNTNIKKEFTLVGAEEADMPAGKLSVLSPLGKALIGKTAGETAIFSSPAGEVTYDVIAVS